MAWLLTSIALVLLMTPGVALLYGGMNRLKGALNVIMMCLAATGVVTVLWVLYGYSVSLGGDSLGGVIGDLSKLGLAGVTSGNDLAFVAFQMMFAIITTALIAGAISDRTRYVSWVVFTVVWVSLVYLPVAHWVWGEGGWLNSLGVLDFAGGTAVHINAGAAALALALVLGRRLDWPSQEIRPHNVPLMLVGGALLWFGWFGFNAGSALAADDVAALSALNTQIAAGAGVLGWIVVEWIRHRPTTLGAVSGAIAGLVAITPACAFVEPLGALAIGAVAGVACAVVVGLKYRLGYDDSLDVVGLHLAAGVIGSLLIGLFATDGGLFYGDGLEQLGLQALGVAVVTAYSCGVSFVLGKVIDKLIGFRVPPEVELEGVDLHEHAEVAYATT